MGGAGRAGKKVQGTRSIKGRNKIVRGRVRIVWEMEKSKNLHVWSYGHELRGGMLVGGGYRAEGTKGEKKMGQL